MVSLQLFLIAVSLYGLVSGVPAPDDEKAKPSGNSSSSNDSQDLKPYFSMKPAMTNSFADPALFTESDHSYWAFATDNIPKTTGNGTAHSGYNVQMANSSDFTSWNYLSHDALPFAGKWAASAPHIWAPDVVKLDNGKYVLYYAAAPADNQFTHCIGAASSDYIQGPYKPQDRPLYCSDNEGGAIDPAGFRDPDGGRRYVMFKIDGNHNQKGGMCGNVNTKPRATPIRIQEVSKDDGMTFVGGMVQILDRDDSDGPLVEAPSMVAVKHDGAANGYLYILFYSSHCFLTPNYNVRYAVSTNGVLNGAKPMNGSIVKADYRKNPRPLITTNSSGLIGPGGLDVDPVEGLRVVFHAAQQADIPGSRRMHIGTIAIDGESVTL